MLNKKEIRKEMLKLRSLMTPEEVYSKSYIICEKVKALDVYNASSKIAIYSPIRNEVNVSLLWKDIIEHGKELYLPRINGDIMNFYRVYDESDLKQGAYNIMEPQGTEMLLANSDTLIIMPGSVFSTKRDRIGYGGGYYDTFLAKNQKVKTVAVCYDFQIVDSILTEEFDIKPDIVISETRIQGE